MTLLTPCPSSRRPRVLGLFANTPFHRRADRVSHVHRCTVNACRALRPRGCRTRLPTSSGAVLSSRLVKPSTIPALELNGAQSLQPEGLRPTPSLPTLDCAVTGRQPKTRYRMRRVTASRAGLPSASTIAPRGAQPEFPNSARSSLTSDLMPELPINHSHAFSRGWSIISAHGWSKFSAQQRASAFPALD